MNLSNTDLLIEVEKTANVLRKGGVILYPTDTIWGIGCDATNADAVQRVYQIKERDTTKSMLLLTHSMHELTKYTATPLSLIQKLLSGTDKPTTVVYPHAQSLPANLPASDGSIGFRLPHDEFCLALLEIFGKPIVSTSANFSGQPFPKSFSDISGLLISRVDYVVNHRREEVTQVPPSRVICLMPDGEVKLIRD